MSRSNDDWRRNDNRDWHDWQDRPPPPPGWQDRQQHSGYRYRDNYDSKGKGDWHGKGGKGKSGWAPDILSGPLAGGAINCRLYETGQGAERVLWMKAPASVWSKEVVEQVQQAVETIVAANDPEVVKTKANAEATAKVLQDTLLPALDRIGASLERRNEDEVECVALAASPAQPSARTRTRAKLADAVGETEEDVVEINEPQTCRRCSVRHFSAGS